MAGISNDWVKTRSRRVVHDVVFDGALLSSTRAVLVTELLHYFLYERQQIPLPIDQLRLQTATWTSEYSNRSKPTNTSPSPRSKSDLCRQGQNWHRHEQAKMIASNRKAKSLLADLKQVTENLKRAFETCTEIEQVALLLGGTVISPKESLLINFPPPCPDADCLSVDKCKRTLFKQVICGDFLGSLSSCISPSNIILILLAPRSQPISWFLPKHTLTSPKTGTVVSINFHCTYLVPICHNLTIEEESINISGLEALECTQCENEDLDCSRTNEKGKTGSTSSQSKSTNVHDVDSAEDVYSSNSINQSSSPKVPSQFCIHQKLNYIYRTYEKNSKKIISSPTGCALSLPHLDSSIMDPDGTYTCENGNYGINQSSGETLKVSESTNECEKKISKVSIDCLWYQCPIILKGFRD